MICTPLPSPKELLSGSPAALALGLNGKSIWNRHRNVYRYACDKREKNWLAEFNGVSEAELGPGNMSLMLRSEILELARTHPDYRFNPEIEANVLACAVLHVSPQVFASMMEKSNHVIQQAAAALIAAGAAVVVVSFEWGWRE